jgi:hypothetical protein
MYSSETKLTRARKPHICTSCGEAIDTGGQYARWNSCVDDAWFTNKMHPECLEMHLGESWCETFEYDPYQYERPEKA